MNLRVFGTGGSWTCPSALHYQSFQLLCGSCPNPRDLRVVKAALERAIRQHRVPHFRGVQHRPATDAVQPPVALLTNRVVTCKAGDALRTGVDLKHVGAWHAFLALGTARVALACGDVTYEEPGLVLVPPRASIGAGSVDVAR
eukprot:CAMPEP_0196726528 /NCGR_PEP_ID=MMETSP1091-20130531/7778_1 /TAXON_ID=302021 /ORGANISM="Rhodomonas sp., Strain CCMP768" /LENGTH=142 /DNA_ID=CAMNT_0042068981 /DNA_START=212 /DNA_END=640 /DNA_ORIENTATION=-